MMKKLGLISIVLAGLSLATVGCASKEVAANPETTSAQAPVAQATVDESAQGDAAVQADPSVQSDQPQATPAADGAATPSSAQ